MNNYQNKKTGKLAEGLAYLALKCSKLAANSVCTITYHDIEKPEELKKLRNFSNEKIADLLTGYIGRKGIIKETDYAIYTYGFQYGLELGACFVICFIITALMGELWEEIIFWLIFLC